ncbi:Glycosyltransferase involved in cell wall bisynthesis [Mesonia phycicola]|uniref:Glycosyltransferase involved in cell wall bisynthesis n=1 Tax=Mesonia phycicola TaxID=579105 RepID=A0A1M6EZ03_9FLAO|nr:glycosyltransferase [Mesonia phycicola]SHI90662.1 Glycosyltransferase involved in cell wall bisynthesis [Mesonia phycicola]
MKIALLGSSEFEVNTNAENYLQEYIRELVIRLIDKGHQVTYFGCYGSKLPCEVYSLNLDSIDWSYDHDISENVKTYAEKQHAYFEIFKYLQESDFDLIHNLSGEQIPVFTAQFLDIPTITTLFDKPKGLLQSSVKLNQTSKNYYIALDHEIANSWMGHSKIDEIIGRGINYESYRFSVKAETNQVVYLGNIIADNNLENIIDAVSQMGYVLKIYGEIVDEYYYRNFIEPLLSDRVEYCGVLNPKDYEASLSAAQVSLVASKQFYGYQNLVIESLSTGTPVVLIAKEYHMSILPEFCGVQIKLDDVSILRKALISASRKSREDCRTYVEENFKYSDVVESYISFYHKVLSN